jgi:hypothetical protein
VSSRKCRLRGSGFSERASGFIPASKAFVAGGAQTKNQVVPLVHRPLLGSPRIALSRVTIDKGIGGLYNGSIGEIRLSPTSDLRN